MFTDGLKREIDNSITIDVAYKYFNYKDKKFIVADSPGHYHYIKNMFCSASFANIMLILVDASIGLSNQTMIHFSISRLLRIQYIIICVNKMDLVNYDEIIFNNILKEFSQKISKLNRFFIFFVPVSALIGDNIAFKSDLMKWYSGPCLFELISTLKFRRINKANFSCVIQLISELKNRGNFYYLGQILNGKIQLGDEIKIFPGGFEAKVVCLFDNSKRTNSCQFPSSVRILTDKKIRIPCGSIICKQKNKILEGRIININICWFSKNELKQGDEYLLRHITNLYYCRIIKILHKLDLLQFNKIFKETSVQENEIANIVIETNINLHFEAYKNNIYLGSLVLIDRNNNEVVGAGIMNKIEK